MIPCRLFSAARRTRRPATAVALAVSVALLSACSSDDDDDTDEPDTTPPDTSQPSPTIDLVPESGATAALGTVLMDRDTGVTLYTRPADDPDVVTCVDDCAATFPPLLTDVDMAGISGDFDIIDTAVDQNQWTFRGYPLHTHTGDAAAGETNGQGVDDAWYVARPVPISSADSADGEVLAVSGSILTQLRDPATRLERDGYTLYRFANDSAGVSTCNDICADTWPPLYADIGAVSGDRYTVIDRTDGTRQWTLEGTPLYLYSGDTAAAQLNGNDIPDWSAVTQ